VEQAVDQHLALGAVEGRDLQGEPGVDLLDDLVDLPPQVPADARHEETVEHRHGREHAEEEDHPEGEIDAGAHRNPSDDSAETPRPPWTRAGDRTYLCFRDCHRTALGGN